MNEQEFLKNFGGSENAGRKMGIPDDVKDSFNSLQEMMSDFDSESKSGADAAKERSASESHKLRMPWEDDGKSASAPAQSYAAGSDKPLRPWETPAPARNDQRSASSSAAAAKKAPEINENDGEGTDKNIEKCPFCKRRFSANIARKLLGSSNITVCEKCADKLSKEYDACLAAEDDESYQNACEELVEKIDTSGFARNAAIDIQNLLNKELTEQKMAKKIKESEMMPEQIDEDEPDEINEHDPEDIAFEPLKSAKKRFSLFRKKEEIGYWEYKTIDLGKSGGIGLNARKIEKVLNKLGREGWRLKAVLSDLQEKEENQYSSPDESFGKTKEYAVDQNIIILERYVKIDL